ncbi:hypothetical protein GQ42DRAFT_118311 [Ramicandelaber brevisporus]|nr:hypothetical protein GQ42DRAFT_118311 [Ramicandelaber brevisporus]
MRSVEHLHDNVVVTSPDALPTKERFYRKRKYWYWCIGLTLVFLAIFIPLLIFVIFPAIAQTIINKSKMSFKTADITNPQEMSMDMGFVSELTNTGPFPATIVFTEPVRISWNNKQLGQVEMPEAHVSGGSGTVKAQTVMKVADAETFGDFAPHMLTDKDFTWLLEGKINVKALGLTAKNLDLKKEVTILGMGGLQNVKITKFDMPNDAPDGNGAVVKLSTDMQNPSPIAVQLGTIDLKMFYKDYTLGIVSAEGATLGRAGTNLDLQGVIPRPSDDNGRAILSELFSNYASNRPSNTTAVGVSVKPDGKNEVSWLSKGLKAMVLHVPLAPPTPMQLITGIKINDMNLNFDPSKPYAPVTSSKSIVAQYNMPFGFTLKMKEVANDMTIFRGNNEVVSLSAPYATADSDKTTIKFALDKIPMKVADNNQPNFDSFCTDLTLSQTVEFTVAGSASTKADTPFGLITLSGIPFNVSSSLGGLQGFNSVPPSISKLDVTDGTESGLNLDLGLVMSNPSPISLSLNSDVKFQMVYANGEVGSVTLPKLTLNSGENSLNASSLFTPNANPQGIELLNRYLNQVPKSPLIIKGTMDSVEIKPLKEGMSKLAISANMPGLDKNLVTGASLVVPWDSEKTNLVSAGVEMSNPFKAGLTVLSVNSNIQSMTTMGQLNLGTADVDSSRGGWNSFDVPARGSAKSALPVSMGLKPEELIALIYYNARDRSDVDTTLFVGMLGLSDYSVPGVPINKDAAVTAMEASKPIKGRSRIIPRALNYDSFNIPDFVKNALKRLAADLDIKSNIQVGKYKTQINLIQKDLLISTDDSMRFLIPKVARPIVQKIVNGAVMGVDTVFMHEAKETSAKVQMAGSITNSGPFSASFSFAEPMEVHWNDKPIGNVKLESIQNKANVGATFKQDPLMSITDVAHMTDFASFMMNKESFSWGLKSSNLSIAALGVEIADVKLDKSISLKGMNGFKNAVKLTSYDMPGDVTPGQQNGIKLSIGTSMSNPSQVGLEVGDASLSVIDTASGFIVGEVGANSMTIQPVSDSSITLNGRLLPQTESDKLKAVGNLMDKYLSGVTQPMQSKGLGVVTGNSTVSWLNTAFKTLQLNLDLPGLQNFKIVQGLDLVTNAMKFTPETAYAPPTSAGPVRANYKLPFPITLAVRKIQQDVTVLDNGVAFARLTTGQLDATNDDKTIFTSFENVPFSLINNGAKNTFNQFLADVTMSEEKKVQLKGKAVTSAMTGVGLLDLPVPIDVETSFKGLRGLIAPPPVVNSIDVISGTPTQLNIRLDTNINNPSNVNLTVTPSASFDLTYSNQKVGEVEMDVNLQMGDNHMFPIAHFHPTGPSIPAGLEFLTKNINGENTTSVMQGTMGSTNVESLKLAFSKLRIAAQVPGNQVKLLKTSSFSILPPPAKLGTAQAGFTMVNPYTATMSIFKIKSNITYHGVPLGYIDTDLSSKPFVCAGKSEATRSDIPLNLNLNPKVLIAFIKTAAAENGVDLGIVGQLLDLYPKDDSAINPQSAHRDQRDDITDIIVRALAGVKVDIVLQAGATMDRYPLQMTYSQKAVPLSADRSVIYLVQLLGGPIVQNIMNNAVMSVDSVAMSNLQATMFSAGLLGAVSNAGPLDAIITIPGGADVFFNNKKLGVMSLSDINVFAGKGAKLDDKATFAISDIAGFAQFTGIMMGSKDFTWTIKSDKVLVKALGFEFPNVKLTKDIKLKGFDGLNQVSVTRFDLPGNAPGNDGIITTMGASLYNPSNIAIDLGSVQFDVYLGHDADTGKLINLGRVHSDTSMALKAESNNTISMTGTLKRQSDSNALAKISEMFNNFLGGKPSDIEIKGVSVLPPGASAPPPWLQAPFTHLIIALILPGYGQLPGQKPENIIRSIDMQDLTLKFSAKDPWNAVASNNQSIATYKLPFNIPVDIQRVGFGIDMVEGGTPAAHLDVPVGPARTSGNLIYMSFKDTKLAVPDSGRSAMQALTRDLTLSTSKTFRLKGKAGSAVGTGVGLLNLDLPIDVDTTLKGLQGLKAKAPTVSNIKITGGTNQYLIMTLDTTMYNPSNIDLITDGTTKLAVANSETELGSVLLENLRLVPGDNSAKAVMHLEPANKAAGQEFMNQFLAGKTLGVNLHGTSDSSPIGPLQAAFAAVALQTTIPGMAAKFIDHTVTYILDLAELLKGGSAMTAEIFMLNPFDSKIFVVSVDESSIKLKGDEIATLDRQAKPNPPVQMAPKGNGRVVVDLKPNILNVLKHPELIGSLLTGQPVPLDLTFVITNVLGDSPASGFANRPSLAQSGVPNYMKLGSHP